MPIYKTPPIGINNISKDSVIYDLERHYNHARKVYDGEIDGQGLSKEGAFRRMQVYYFAIEKLK